MISTCARLSPTLLLLGCVPVGASGQVGYARMKVAGQLALDAAGNQGSIEQGVDSAFGLGQGEGSPYYRAQVDFGGPVVTASAFWLRDSGRGELADAFGGFASGTSVASRLDVAVAKIGASYDFDLGLVKVSPGVLFDVFALDFSARELTLNGREEIDDIVFVPMPAVRAESRLGSFAVVAELGGIAASGSGDNEGRFFDAEAMLEWSPLPLAHLFAGYRLLDIDGSGRSGTESFAVDLQIEGWMIGGGVRF
ncbi:MAG TPA: hypothetical protein ENI87_02900 [bacterium]|nr:hypothetical protein [bacterium]